MGIIANLFGLTTKKEVKQLNKELDSVKNEIIKLTSQDIIDELYSIGESTTIDNIEKHK